MESTTHQIETPDGSRLHLHLTVPKDEEYTKATVTLFVATDAGANPPLLGSMVYALPGPKEVLSTRLYQVEESIDSAERLAKAVCKRINRPVIVSASSRISSITTIGQIASKIEECL